MKAAKEIRKDLKTILGDYENPEPLIDRLAIYVIRARAAHSGPRNRFDLLGAVLILLAALIALAVILGLLWFE